MSDRAGVAIAVAVIGAAATIGAALIAVGAFGDIHFGSGNADQPATVVVNGTGNGTGTGNGHGTDTGKTDSKGPTADQMASFIRSYYAQLPSGTDSAWNQLSSSYQSQSGGYAGYTKFWSTVTTVQVGSITNTDYRTSTATLTYTYATGKTQTEKRWLRVEYVNSKLQITASGT
ncbi:hypothetical protein ABZ412_30060 [Nocardia sp. NPDC005746]|uniref:hypothetical protein n=1 Tax=Nocardia sp. NPDC005746 TaxID=3157062 RepID=UPI0033FA272E